MKHSAFLKIDHVDKSFSRGAGTSEVLRDVSLTIDQGEYVSIIGHSGCGKSTLLNIVAGLTPPTSGGVLLENREVFLDDCVDSLGGQCALLLQRLGEALAHGRV